MCDLGSAKGGRKAPFGGGLRDGVAEGVVTCLRRHGIDPLGQVMRVGVVKEMSVCTAERLAELKWLDWTSLKHSLALGVLGLFPKMAPHGCGWAGGKNSTRCVRLVTLPLMAIGAMVMSSAVLDARTQPR